ADVDGLGGAVLLVADGDQATDILTINANVTTDTNTISLYAGADIVLQSGSIATTTSGAISLIAATDYDGGAPVLGVGFEGGLVSNPGNITITAAGGSAITLYAEGGIGAAGNAILTAGSALDIDN